MMKQIFILFYLALTNIEAGVICRGQECQTSTAKVLSTTEVLPSVEIEKIDQSQVAKEALVIGTGGTQVLEVRNNDTLNEDSLENANIKGGRELPMESTETVDDIEEPEQEKESVTPAIQPNCEEVFEDIPGTITNDSPQDRSSPDYVASVKKEIPFPQIAWSPSQANLYLLTPCLGFMLMILVAILTFTWKSRRKEVLKLTTTVESLAQLLRTNLTPTNDTTSPFSPRDPGFSFYQKSRQTVYPNNEQATHPVAPTPCTENCFQPPVASRFRPQPAEDEVTYDGSYVSLGPDSRIRRQNRENNRKVQEMRKIKYERMCLAAGEGEVFRPICTSPSSAFTPYQNTVTPTTSPSVQSNSMDTTVQMDPGGDLLSEEGVSKDKNGGQEEE